MTSKKGAKEETKKKLKFGQRGAQKEVFNLKAFFCGPRLAKFVAFFRIFYGSPLRSHYFPSLRASWCRF